MNISSDSVGDYVVVRLQGNLDTNTSSAAQEALDELLNGGATRVLVNLEQVGFVSSNGLRVLLATAKRLGGPNSNLRVCCLNDTVNEVFEISGFSNILNVFGTEEEALQGS